MIYLFDDNERGQHTTDIISVLKKYPNIIKYYDKFPSEKELDKIIPEAKMVFIHHSFSPIGTNTNGRIRTLARDNGVRLIIFSGTKERETKKEDILMIKSEFYHNLVPFLKSYKNFPENTEIELLIYGEDYKIERALVIQEYLNLVLIQKSNFNYDQIFDNTDSNEAKNLEELFKLAYDIDTWEDELSNFDENAIDNSSSVKEISTKIKELVSKIKKQYEK